MSETKKSLTVHIFKTATVNGRGELTIEGEETLKKVKQIPFFEKCYVGSMFEALATARKLMGRIITKKPEENPQVIPGVGSDYLIEKLLDKGDEEIIKVFLDFLQAKKEEGLTQILIITSPIYVMIMKYIERSRVKKLGSLRDFVTFVDEAIQWEGTRIPLVARGDYETFQF